MDELHDGVLCWQCQKLCLGPCKVDKQVVNQENERHLKKCVASTWMKQHIEKIREQNLLIAVKRVLAWTTTLIDTEL